MTIIPMFRLTPSKEVLRGSVLGGSHARNLELRLKGAEPCFPLVLDFAGVEAATASYLKEFFGPFFSGDHPSIVPVATGLSVDLREDLQSFLSEKKWVVCEVSAVEERAEFVRFLGTPEISIRETFELLRTLGEASATALFDRSPDKGITPTAWNNRLTTLLNLRLAHRRKDGRMWIYQTVFTD